MEIQIPNFPKHFVIICLFQQWCLGERCKLPQWGPRKNPESQSIFMFY